MTVLGMGGHLAEGTHEAGSYNFWTIRRFLAELLGRQDHPACLMMSMGLKRIWPGDKISLSGNVSIFVAFRTPGVTAAIENHKVTDEMTNDFGAMLEVIIWDIFAFYRASKELTTNLDFIIEVLKVNVLVFPLLDCKFRKDRDFVLLAAGITTGLMPILADEFSRDRDVVARAISNDAGTTLIWARHFWGDASVVRLAFHADATSLSSLLWSVSQMKEETELLTTIKALIPDFYGDVVVMKVFRRVVELWGNKWLSVAPPSFKSSFAIVSRAVRNGGKGLIIHASKKIATLFAIKKGRAVMGFRRSKRTRASRRRLIT